jgi:hypothetical protein
VAGRTGMLLRRMAGRSLLALLGILCAAPVAPALARSLYVANTG